MRNNDLHDGRPPYMTKVKTISRNNTIYIFCQIKYEAEEIKGELPEEHTLINAFPSILITKLNNA